MIVEQRLFFLGITVVFVALVAICAPSYAVPEYIYGIHDSGGEQNMADKGTKGWILFTEEIGHDPANQSGMDYSQWSNQGYGVIVRLNNGYGSNGTLPYESQYDNFAQRCANYVSHSPGVTYWIIGNECNLAREWPGNNNGDITTGEPITVGRYVSCYNKVYAKIMSIAPSAQLVPAPAGTWGPPYAQLEGLGFMDYWLGCINGIGASKISALGLHAYTHGCDPQLVTSESMMGYPYGNIHYNFRVYKDYMVRIPSSMSTKPVLITECDQNVECADGGAAPRHTWSNTNSGWVRAIYGEINSWNTNSSQKILCVILFRWQDVAEGEWGFGIQNRQGVIDDWRQAMDAKYKWSTGSTGEITNDAPTGANLAPRSAQCQTDSNLTQNSSGMKAIDGIVDASSKWTSTATSATHWLALDLGSDKTVSGFVVRHASAAGEPDYFNTKSFSIQSALSLAGPWMDEVVVDNSTQAAVTTRSYVTPKSLRYVRLYITIPGTDNYARIPEFEVWCLDPTPPTTPSVTDDGVYTTAATQLHCLWSSADPESGVVEYQYAIGTSPERTDVVDWTSVRLATGMMRTGLSLSYDSTYYISVKARNALGMWSSVGSSNGITIARAVSSIVAAKVYPDGSAVQIAFEPVSAVIGPAFWMEEPNRTSAIKVNSPSAFALGTRVQVGGRLATVCGERMLDQPQISQSGITMAPLPLALRNSDLGGASLNTDTPGVMGGVGVNNIGTLVRVWGKVTKLGSDHFYLDDGAALKDGSNTGGSANVGVRVLAAPAGMAVGDYVIVTGVITCFEVSGGNARAVLPLSDGVRVI